MSIPHLYINAAHIAVIAPAIGYLGWKGYNGEKIELGKMIGIVLLVLALVIIIYHAYRIKTKSWSEYKASVASPNPAPALVK